MRVLAVVPPDPWVEVNVLQTLRQHYCEDLYVFLCPEENQLGLRQWRARRDALNEDLVRLAGSLRSTGRLDVIFFIVYDDFLTVETAKSLRALGVPMVNYHIDMVFQWYRVIRTAPFFDLLAVAQMSNAEHLAAYNPNIEWMPMAANPSFYHSRAGTVPAYQYQVSFIGSFNPYRRALLAECVRRNITPVVFGQGWRSGESQGRKFKWDPYKVLHDLRFYAVPRWRVEGLASVTGPITRKYSRWRALKPPAGLDCRGPCETEALPAIFRVSQVNLGFSDTGWHSKKGIVRSGMLQCRLRDFEVPMSGGFYLVQEAPDHREYYVIGKEIETWSAPEELVDKVKFYSRNEEAARRIREAGQKRALESHTWRHRFDRLFVRLRSVGRLS